MVLDRKQSPLELGGMTPHFHIHKYLECLPKYNVLLMYQNFYLSSTLSRAASISIEISISFTYTDAGELLGGFLIQDQLWAHE